MRPNFTNPSRDPDVFEVSIHRRLFPMPFSTQSFLRFMPPILCAALVIAVPLSAQASVKNPTAASVLKATKAAMIKQSGVHVKVTSLTGKSTSSVVVDIGSSFGMESITTGIKKVIIIVTPTYAYLSGSPTGLISIMGLTSTQEKKVGTRSISMKAGTAPYISFKSRLTTTVLSGILPVTRGTTFSVANDKMRDYRLTWKSKSTTSASEIKSILTISSGDKTLPKKETISSSTGGGSTTFSKWGENVTEVAPAMSSTIPYAKVLGG